MNNLSSNTPTIYSNAFSRRPVRIWPPAPTFQLFVSSVGRALDR